MKQYISIDDLNQLSDKGKEKLREWWKPEGGDLFYQFNEEVIYGGLDVDFGPDGADYYKAEPYTKALPLLNIGQMIDFLGDNWYAGLFGGHCCMPRTDKRTDIEGESVSVYKGEFCDALWYQCKEILERE